MDNKWLMPKYYKSFICKSNNCLYNCCQNWDITYSSVEYKKLVSHKNGSQKLKVNLSKALDGFNDKKNKNTICLDNGFCPLLDSGLCLIHKELGQKSSLSICRKYPRIRFKINDEKFAVCDTSCSEVVSILYDLEDYEIIEDDLNEDLDYSRETSDESKSAIKTYVNILNNKDETLTNNIKNICLLMNKEEYSKYEEIIAEPVSTALFLLNRLFSKNSNKDIINIYKQVAERYTNKTDLYFKDKEELLKNIRNGKRLLKTC